MSKGQLCVGGSQGWVVTSVEVLSRRDVLGILRLIFMRKRILGLPYSALDSVHLQAITGCA